MKHIKFIYISVGIIVLVFIVIVAIFFLKPQKVNVGIIDITVKNHNVNNSDVASYGIESKVLYDDNVNFKEIELKCNIENKSAEDMHGIWAIFNADQELPAVICGDKLETKRPDSIKIKPSESKEVKFYFLVNAASYDDETILRLIKDVEIYIIKDGNPGSTQGVTVSNYLKMSK